MNISRRDDRHNADLAKEISDSFNRAIGAKQATEKPQDEQDKQDSGPQPDEQPPSPQFVVTGDKRDTGSRRRR
ncbi:hypothetical protein BJF85_13465 [Saccharomonospora sp. CUA-673]|uniref:hypothetical protein n=1 Tax=Saccharomonospora sp. CUA-673 TaxID=1904969 RepID=UPI00096086F0|nr:hypothetical protein [Saccharomonospora sp. CUA-673]OLT48230.1 hypothetical protein BJF85_13465 [Saccharomonospora sp. CUA-673]